MKEIKIKIEEDVYSELKSSLICKKMSGSMYGTLDELLMLIFKTIEDGEKELNLKFRGRRRDGKERI